MPSGGLREALKVFLAASQPYDWLHPSPTLSAAFCAVQDKGWQVYYICQDFYKTAIIPSRFSGICRIPPPPYPPITATSATRHRAPSRRSPRRSCPPKARRRQTQQPLRDTPESARSSQHRTRTDPLPAPTSHSSRDNKLRAPARPAERA